MKWFKNIYFFLSSKALTVWFVGLFVLYYLSVSVWWKEAFGMFIMGMSSNNVVKSLYVIFLLNVVLRTAGAVKANVANKFRLILRLPLYIGIMVFFVSSFMSVNVRDQRWLLLGEGDSIDLEWEKEKFAVRKIDPAIKKNLLQMDDSLVFSYEPKIVIMDSDRYLYKIGAFPPEKVGSTYMHILNFGLAPGVELRRGEHILSKGYVVQRIVPFGRMDSFELKPLPYKFYLRILPNKIIKKGDVTARNYDIDKPRYGIEVVKGDKKIYEGETDSSVSFDDDITLDFFSPINWVMLEVVRDPFYLWFVLSLIMLVIGSLIYPMSFLKKGSRIQGVEEPRI
ncbi:MAG: hypothetical protein V3V59_03700 [Thermodesulfovibrionales bacterium]